MCSASDQDTPTAAPAAGWSERIRNVSHALVRAAGVATGADDGGEQELECSMTFVNVPWQSIVLDLLRDVHGDGGEH